MRRLTLLCGTIGGVWALLAPALVLLPVIGRATGIPGEGTGKKETVSMIEAGMAGDALPWLAFISLMGVLGLLSLALYQGRPRLSRTFAWGSALFLLAVSGLSFASIGMFFMPAAVLLLIAAANNKA
ncbi:MAG: hypothetical protein HYX91_00220 [Chloroflexi bacterium]|nr:hypothetical protein [Chloroflexota bacterium]